MEISILVTVKNDLMNIKSLISSLKQNIGKYEVVVVDAHSSDGTFEYLKSEKENLQMILIQKEGNRAIGRNESIRASSGAKMIFLDSDTIISNQWLEILKTYLDRDVVAGKIVQTGHSKWSELERVPMIYDGRDVTYPANNYMIGRTVIEGVGAFDERFNTAEDIDMNIRLMRAGYNITYADDLVVYHNPRQDFSALMRQSFNDGKGRKIIKEKYGLKSSFNISNLKKHPMIEFSRLTAGMLGYITGG